MSSQYQHCNIQQNKNVTKELLGNITRCICFNYSSCVIQRLQEQCMLTCGARALAQNCVCLDGLLTHALLVLPSGCQFRLESANKQSLALSQKHCLPFPSTISYLFSHNVINGVRREGWKGWYWGHSSVNAWLLQFHTLETHVYIKFTL